MKKAGLAWRASSPNKKGESVYNPSSMSSQDQGMNFDAGNDQFQEHVFKIDMDNNRNFWSQKSGISTSSGSACVKSFARLNNKMPSPTPLLRLDSIGEVSSSKNFVNTPQRNSAKQYSSPTKLKLHNCHSADSFPKKSLASPSFISTQMPKPCYQSTPKLLKSKSLPEVSSVPYAYHDCLGSHPVSQHTLSSSFDSPATAMNMPLLSDMKNVAGAVTDKVIPTLIKSLVMEKMVEAMQSPSGTDSFTFKEPTQVSVGAPKTVEGNFHWHQHPMNQSTGASVQLPSNLPGNYGGKIGNAHLSDVCCQCSDRRNNCNVSPLKCKELKKTSGCSAHDNVAPLKEISNDAAIETTEPKLEISQVNGHVCSRNSVPYAHFAQPNCDDGNRVVISDFDDNNADIPPEVCTTSPGCGVTSTVLSEDGMRTVNKENDASSCSATNLLSDLSSVLFDRKKCTKKGRPSSKKQKKRRREKIRQADSKSLVGESSHEVHSNLSDSSVVFVSSPCDRQPSSGESGFSPDSKCEDNSSVRSSHTSISFSDSLSALGTFSGSPAPESQFGGLASRIFSMRSEESSSSDASDSDDASFSDDDDDWSDNLDNSLSSQLGVVGSIAIKGKDSKVASVPGNSDSCSRLDTSFTDEDSCDDSIDFSSSPTVALSFTEEQLKLFGPRLYVDNNVSHCANSISKSDTGTPKCWAGKNDVKSLLSEDNDDDLKLINAKWLKHYPSACSKHLDTSSISEASCCCNTKVHFAADPVLVTVHMVGAEDRRGEWMSYAVDRERFGRVIQQCGDAISPILQPGHRDKVYERNLKLQALREQ
ncbi:uncharacterized protein LOC101861786 [Aplysia californica]|uniref:Uncharacterized protein LOC101861786 n=1 Tax=Aplysia californica TaxID=6500 RepID=A0ABM0K9X2_APLCA|nr:uncharacterized protein LOC101861786 [Aplysia californica]